ncbi:MAG: UDP-N-acetylmuramate--L-alanine ligase [Chloroflexi bacterium]|nr:UDP-N-acetylmuramate--L-alanine ligase [Chloroflexota bacterium]
MIPSRVHLVGIGGIGLSGIARILLARGHAVSGSDMQPSLLLAALTAEGAQVHVGHRAENLGSAEMVIISSAIPPQNPEVQEARRRGLPVLKRGEVLGDLIGPRRTVAVAGTHGKTTTTGMIAQVLEAAGLAPSFIIGGIPASLGTNARHGHGEWFVIEADEYDRMFLGLRPEVAVVTHMEWDHPDCYPTPESLQQAFAQFVRSAPNLVACADQEAVRQLAGAWQGQQFVRYGLSETADLRAVEVEQGGLTQRFSVRWHGEPLGCFHLPMPGQHNVCNALGALAVAGHLGLPWRVARQALAEFRGVARRLEQKGAAAGVTVLDDYAHHPTEIRAALSALRAAYPGQRVWAVFQPHTFSRTQAFFQEFADSLALADQVVVLPVYPAREQGDPLAVGRRLAQQVPGGATVFAASLDEAARWVGQRLAPGDVLVTLGAGDGFRVGEMVLQSLRQAAEAREP